MKKVFFIHENTVPVKIADQYIRIATDFAVSVGYIKEKHEIYNPDDLLSDLVFIKVFDENGNVEFNNYLPEVVFDTFEKGCKVLTTILSKRCNNDVTIRETFNKLAEKYPECAI